MFRALICRKLVIAFLFGGVAGLAGVAYSEEVENGATLVSVAPSSLSGSKFPNLMPRAEIEGLPAPENLQTNLVGAGFVRLSWDPVTSNDAVMYAMERDGELLPEVIEDTTFDDFGVVPDTSYTYRVFAVDTEGILSEEASNEVMVETISEVPVDQFLKMHVFEDVEGSGTADLIFSHRDFPDRPTRSIFINGLDFGEGDIGDNYGALVTGTLTPSVSGDYYFFIRSNDASEFFLNPTGSTAPNPSVNFPIAFEETCCNPFVEPGEGDQTTIQTFSLEAGKAYGMAVVLKEADGEDWFQVAWRLEGDDTPAEELHPITGSAIGGTFGDPTGAWIDILSQPQGGIVPAGASKTIRFNVDAGSPYTPLVLYQWMKDGEPIGGATRADFIIEEAVAADAGDYSCRISVLGMSTITENASIVIQEPAVLSVGNTIGINFGADEPAGNRSDVEGEAGVLGTTIWNNLNGANGVSDFLFADVNGAEGLTGVSVTWDSPNTWSSRGRGEENNEAEGESADLMTGYIDTNDTDSNQVMVSGLPENFAYDVVVYIKGAVIGRGGDYTLNSERTLAHIDTAPFSGEFIEGEEGDYIVFSEVSGSSFVLEGFPTSVRAPINGLDILLTQNITPPGTGEGKVNSISVQNGQVVVQFEGTLKSSDSVTGPYTTVEGASSPYFIDPVKAAGFYIAE